MGRESTERDAERAVPVDDARVRCPKCGWKPSRHDRWQCSCLHVWNTFDTRGQCPACGKRWEDTQCLRCKQWSPHEAWYAPESSGSG